MSDTTAKPRSHTQENEVSKLISGKEQTVYDSSYWAESLLKPYNPDDLYQKKGNHSIYEDMMRDDQVYSVLQTKKDLVMNSGWTLKSEEEDGSEIVEDLWTAVDEDPDRSLDEMILDILSAYEFGFSIAEKTFKKRDDGKISLRNIKARHPDTWLIHTNKHGNVENFEQQGDSHNIVLDPRQAIHYINNPKFDNAYGTSDLRPCYTAWFTKTQIIRYYAIFLEKAAAATPVAKYPTNTPEKAVDDLFNAIKKFQTKTALVVPKDMEIEFLESKSNGEAYIKGINIFNMFIGRSVLMPDLFGLHGAETGGGSYALGEEHINIFFKHIMARRRIIESIINTHIIDPIVTYNFGDVEFPPKFEFLPIKEENQIEFAKTWIEAMKGRIYKPSDDEINRFRSMINFPEGEVEEDTRPPSDSGFSGPGVDNPVVREPVADQTKEGPIDEKDLDDPEKFAFSNTDGDFHKRVDFKALENQLDNNLENFMSAVEPLQTAIFADLYDQLARKKILERKDISRMETVKLKKLKDMKQLLKSSLMSNYKEAQVKAQKELFKSAFAEPLVADEFLTLLEQETFNYIGDWEYNVTKGARQAMIQAIKDGKPLSDVINLLDEDGKRASRVSLERFARTKLTETMNQGRKEFFSKSNIVSGYQYSAIMDSVTTPICSGLHGKKFKTGTEPTPPNHFNCRSVLIPITIYEEFTPDSSLNVEKKEVTKRDGSTTTQYRPVKKKTKTSTEVDIPTFINNTKGVGF